MNAEIAILKAIKLPYSARFVMKMIKTMVLSQVCVMRCVAMHFRYAATKGGTTCLCGNGYNKQGESTGCDRGCSGDKNEICGGTNSISVYQIYPKEWETGMGEFT